MTLQGKGVVWHPWGNYGAQAPIDTDATDMQNAGITFARTGIDQSSDLAVYDRVVASAVAHNITLLINLQGQELATDQSSWVTWVNSIVTRYSASVHFWEVSNEVDLLIVGLTHDPVVFASDVHLYMLHVQATYQAIKALQPGATVLLGGISNAGNNDPPQFDIFVNCLRDNEAALAPYIDGFNYHPYAATPADAAAQITAVKAKLAGTPYARKPFWVTEIGWFTGNIEAPGPSQTSTEAIKAANLTNTWPALRNVGIVQPIFWYNLHETTDGITGSGYGLTLRDSVSLSDTPQPAYSAMAGVPWGQSWYDASYTYKKRITIDHTKVAGGASLTNFPVLISRVDPDLKVTGSGGSVQNASGFDIIFVDTTETVKLDHEVQKYVSSTGEIEMWVRIPTLSASVDTIIYLYYDNSAISTSQENKSGVWDANYQAVWHMSDNAATTTVVESTSYANTGAAAVTTSTKTTAGKWASALNFNGISDQVSVPLASSLQIIPQTTGMTAEFWVNLSVAQIANESFIGTNAPGYVFGVASATQLKAADGGGNNFTGSITLTTSAWHHLVFTIAPGTNNAVVMYLDGVNAAAGNSTTFVSGTSWTTPLLIGNQQGFYQGSMQEVRLSKVVRSAGWVTTSYNNQNSPTTFISVVGPIITTPLSLYGSKVAASTPATAGQSSFTPGGTEVAAVTTAPALGSGYVECFALGGTSTVNAALPPPSGKGWILDSTLLEGQRLLAGNWTASVAVSDANGGGPVNSYTLRFWQRSSGGMYAIIGSLVLSASQVISTLRVVKSFLAAGMPQTDFVVGDKLYIDFFINANGWASDALSVYVSNSGAAGVAGDLEVDTAGFIPSGTAGVVTSYIPRALSALLIVTSTALLDTLSGSGTLTGAISTLSAPLAITFSGGGVLSGQVTANLTLPTTILAGAGSLAGLPSLATSLVTSQFTGSSTLAASILARTVLTSQLAGSSTLASSFQLATSLAGQLAGVDTLSATITANLTLPGIILAGIGTLSGTLSTSTLTPVALAGTLVGGGTLTGTLALTTQLAGTPAGVSTLSAVMTASTTLASTTLVGSGALIGAPTRGTALSTTTLIGAGTLGASLSAALTLSGTSLVGVGAFSGTLTGAGGLVGTLPGGGTLTGSLSATLTLIGTSFAGVDMLSATVQASTVLGATLAGISTLAGTPGARTALGATLAGTGTFTGMTALATALAGAVSSVGTLAGAAGRSTALGVALPGSGQLIAVGSAQTSLTSSFSGIGTAAFTVFLRTSLSITLSGAGNVTSASLSPRVALALSLSGLASLSGSLTVPVLAYLTATWKTRDGQVVWVTRDEQEATWKTRDGQVTWKIRS